MSIPSKNPQHDPITYRFIGHAMKVHSVIGPGLNEEIYHQEIVSALTADGIEHLSKPRRDLIYQNIVVDTFVPDLIVENHVIPELKTLTGNFSAEHLVQLFCYCKFFEISTSLLVDFGKQSLFCERYQYNPRPARLPITQVPSIVCQPSLASSIIHSVRECLAEIGLGYRTTTWRGLVNAAIQAAGHRVTMNPTATVLGHENTEISSLVVDDVCAIYITGLNSGLSAIDRAILQTHLRWLNLDWGIVFHFGKHNADYCFVSRPADRPCRLPQRTPDFEGHP